MFCEISARIWSRKPQMAHCQQKQQKQRFYASLHLYHKTNRKHLNNSSKKKVELSKEYDKPL